MSRFRWLRSMFHRGRKRRHAYPWRPHPRAWRQWLGVEFLETRCLLACGITEFPVATANSQPVGITAGPDGNLWFTEWGANKIGRITASGIVTGEFGIPTANSHTNAITAGPDGNLWFTEANFSANQIERISTDGTFPTPHAFTGLTARSQPIPITSGPDGNVWFGEYNAPNVGRVNLNPPRFDITEIGVARIADIAPGPNDGNLWVTEQFANGIVRITPAGTLTEFRVPTANSNPTGIIAGPDGNLWFTEEVGKIGRLTPGGVFTEYTVPTADSLPISIASGPDGNLWFLERSANKIGRITTDGSITEYSIPTPNSVPDLITAGPDGNLWFTEEDANQIGRVNIRATHYQVTPSPDNVVAGTPFSLTVTAQDGCNNTATGYRGTVHFTSTDAAALLPLDYTFTAADHGVHTFTSVSLRTAGSRTILATDTRDSSIIGSTTVTVTPAAAARFTVADFPSPKTAGDVGVFTVTALDAYGNTATGYRGTVAFTSSDGQAVLPNPYTFTAADAGTKMFGGILKTAGTQSLTATDTGNPSLTGSQTGIMVIPAALDHFLVSTSVDDNGSVAGAPFDVTVTTQDAYNNTVTGYTGTVAFSSQDPYGAALPPAYTFQPSDMGTHTFAGGATLYTAGTWDVTATATATGAIGSDFITVTAAPAVAFQVIAPITVSSGQAFDLTVIAVDPYGNTDMNYQGGVHFTTTDPDPGVVLPPDYTFQAADAGMLTLPGGVTLITPGHQALFVTDMVSGIFGGTIITVTPGSGAGSPSGRFRERAVASLTVAASLQAPPSVAGPSGQPEAAARNRNSRDRLFAAAVRAEATELPGLVRVLSTTPAGPESWLDGPIHSPAPAFLADSWELLRSEVLELLTQNLVDHRR